MASERWCSGRSSDRSSRWPSSPPCEHAQSDGRGRERDHDGEQSGSPHRSKTFNLVNAKPSNVYGKIGGRESATSEGASVDDGVMKSD